MVVHVIACIHSLLHLVKVLRLGQNWVVSLNMDRFLPRLIVSFSSSSQKPWMHWKSIRASIFYLFISLMHWKCLEAIKKKKKRFTIFFPTIITVFAFFFLLVNMLQPFFFSTKWAGNRDIGMGLIYWLMCKAFIFGLFEVHSKTMFWKHASWVVITRHWVVITSC